MAKKKTKRIRIVCAVLSSFALVAVFTVLAGAWLTPHNATENTEAFLLRDYFEDSTPYDVLILGDCEAYASFCTPLLWQEQGISARVIGTPQQLLWHSDAILSAVLQREKPQLVVLSVYAFAYSEPQSEAYNRMSMEALPFSWKKIQTVWNSRTAGESVLSYFLPLLRYHDRWNTASVSDLEALFAEWEPVSLAGYVYDATAVAGDLPNHRDAFPREDTAFGEKALTAFESIVRQCRDAGVELLLVKAPTDSWQYPWFDEWEEQVQTLANTYQAPYWNFLSLYTEIGLNPQTDSSDGGSHLNAGGAEKLTRAFGLRLTEKYALPDRRGEEPYETAWGGVLQRWGEEKEEDDMHE